MAETMTKTEPKVEPKPKQPETDLKPSNKRLVQAPVGCPVQWFPLGMGNEDPRAGVIVGHQGRDACSVLVFEDGGQRIVPTCPHLSDPMLIVHPEMPGVEPDGAWDYIPDMPLLRPEGDEDLDSLATRIVQLSLLHHWAPSQIAKATRTKEEVVRAALAKHAKA